MADLVRARLIDVSRYNDCTDLSKAVDAWGIVGVMARCTIGWAYVDPFYEHNFRQARDLGLLFGAYHVLWPWNKDPLREVQHFKDHMAVRGEPPDFVVDDLELPKPSDDAGWKAVSPKEVGQQIAVQVPAIRDRTGLTTLCYTRDTWWNGPQMAPITPIGIEDDFYLIEAEYTIQKPCGKVSFDKAPAAPRMPTVAGGWTRERTIMWQWTSCLAPIPNGPEGAAACDGDVLLVDYDRFLQIIGAAAPPVSDQVKLQRLWDSHPELHYPGV